jgi:hypothetical protein
MKNEGQERMSIPELPPSYSPAERLYTRLVYRDEAAWKAMEILVRLSKEGHPKALEAWRKIAEVHRRRLPKLEDSAKRLLLRARGRDPSAWTAISILVREAKKGNPRALRAWAVLAKVHLEQGGNLSSKVAGAPRVGYYPFPEVSRAGVDFSPGARVLHPARIQELLELFRQARYAPPALAPAESMPVPGAPAGAPGGVMQLASIRRGAREAQEARRAALSKILLARRRRR